MTPNYPSHIADHSVPLTVQAFNRGFMARPICCSVFRHSSASIASPDILSTMPSADFQYALRSPYGSPSSCMERIPDLPGYSRLLSMRNCRIYVTRLLDNRRTSGCVAPSSLCVPPNIRFFVQSARIFASGFLHALLTKIHLPLATLRRYLAGAGLVPQNLPNYFLDRNFVFGTLAERTSKQPAMPGTQQDA